MYDRIKRLADAKGMTLYEVEEKAGVGQGLISKWKSGANPNLAKIEAVAKVLGVTSAQLLADD